MAIDPLRLHSILGLALGILTLKAASSTQDGGPDLPKQALTQMVQVLLYDILCP